MGRSGAFADTDKVGFKSAKNIRTISVTNTYPGGYREDQGYNWFSLLSTCSTDDC
jgi:DMSO/TMAO reductase YedYZ molybdopterin-dependent catalytic subunit